MQGHTPESHTRAPDAGLAIGRCHDGLCEAAASTLWFDATPLSSRRDRGEAIPTKGQNVDARTPSRRTFPGSLGGDGESRAPAQPILTLTAGNVTKHFTAAELLSRTDLASIQIPPHLDYDVSLTLQAVPLLDLLAGLPLERFDRLEASAKDGFVAQIPLTLIEAGKRGGSVAWIAVEQPAIPGPSCQRKMSVPAPSI
jgi:hypothetical protein